MRTQAVSLIETGNFMSTKSEIRIMIVGDFLIFRSGLKLLLETESKFKVVGEAASLAEAATIIEKIKPDILLIDSSEADTNAFSAFLSSREFYVPSIVLTNTQDSQKQQEYLMLGIDGLVSKEQTADILFNAIKRVSDGDVYFDRRLMSETIKQLVSEKKMIPEKIYAYNCAVLTEREREVLNLICQGMKNKNIADKLFITETTVRHHLTSIFEKLNVNSRLELVVYAFREKLVEIPVESVETNV